MGLRIKFMYLLSLMANRFRHLLLLTLWFSSAANSQERERILVGIGDVPDEAKHCALEGSRSDECDPLFRQTARALQTINEAIDPGLTRNSRDGIDALVPFDLSRTWVFQHGLSLGVHELSIDEVRAAPLRRALEDDRQARGTAPGAWVRHTFEIRPRLSIGYRPETDGPVAINSLLLGFLPQFSIQIQLTKHYDLPEEFPKGFQDRARAFKELLKSSMKGYLKLPSDLGGSSLAPGESVQLDSYVSGTGLSALGNGLGVLNIGALPAVAFTRVGFEYFRTARYRRYTIQKQTDGKIRLLLETPTLKRWGPFTDIGISASLAIIDLSYSVASAGYRWQTERSTGQEYLIDLSDEETRAALKKAYLWGDFTPIESLAEQDCSRATAVQSDRESAHGWRVRFLKWSAGNTHSAEDETYTTLSCDTPGATTSSHGDDLQKVRKSFRANRIFDVGIRRSTGSPGDFSVWIKLNYDAKTPKKGEVVEYLKVAALVDPEDEESLNKIKSELDALASLRKRTRPGDAHAYLSFEFDSAAISAVLAMTPETREEAFRKAWSSLIGTDSRPRSIAYKRHLRRLERFLDAIGRGAKEGTDLDQATEFVKGLQRGAIDLYPFAAMISILPDPKRVTGTARIYLAGPSRNADIAIEPARF